MNDNKYLQLSISAFITAIVIGLGLLCTTLKDWQILCIKLDLLCISILFGIYFFYKYKINDSKTKFVTWFHILIERVNEVIPETAKGITLILSVIIVTQIVFTGAPLDQPTPTPAATTDETTSTTEFSTSTPITCVPCCATPTPTDTSTPTPTETFTLTPTNTPTSTPTITPSPETIGCVDTFGLNVRNSPGVTEDPSNHAQIWLRNDACLTILGTSTTDPEWVHVQFEGFVRLKAGETVYVGTVTPTPTPTPTP